MPSQGPWRSPSWKIIRFGIPKSGSFTEIAEHIKAHGLESAKVTYVDALNPESHFAPNGLTDTGITVMWNVLIGANPYVFSNGNCRLGVSTDLTAFDDSQENLNPSGSATFYMQAIDDTFPSVSGQQCVWQATFDGNTANFLWASFGVDNDAQDGTGDTITSYGENIALLNRYVSNQGSKPSGETWILILLITQS